MNAPPTKNKAAYTKLLIIVAIKAEVWTDKYALGSSLTMTVLASTPPPERKQANPECGTF